MSVEFTDILQLPKHKGKTVQQVFDTEPTYLLWLRDKKQESGRADYFDPSVLKALNGHLKKDGKAATKFKMWNETKDGRVLPPGIVANPAATTPATTAPWNDEDHRPSLAEVTAAQAQQNAYADLWGCF